MKKADLEKRLENFLYSGLWNRKDLEGFILEEKEKTLKEFLTYMDEKANWWDERERKDITCLINDYIKRLKKK